MNEKAYCNPSLLTKLRKMRMGKFTLLLKIIFHPCNRVKRLIGRGTRKEREDLKKEEEGKRKER